MRPAQTIMPILKLSRLALVIAMAGLVSVTDIKTQTPKDLRSVDNMRSQALRIPRIERAPALDDFKDMKGTSAFARSLAHVEGFQQKIPADGAAATQRTDSYLGYDAANIYVVFLCHDSQPDQIRSRLTKRENASGDDQVEVLFDTFQDQRRGYLFASNPVGVQSDGLWSEDNGADLSWDTVWDTNGLRTKDGYMVIMTIPFRSLRFSHEKLQHWGIILHRTVPRNNEEDFWPYVTGRINGRLNQEAQLNGLEDISPGRNMEFNPYGIWRASRSLNSVDSPPRFEDESLGGRVGADAKMVIKDSLVLDVTLKPDFSQVESDEPQVTVNQRFPVFFPEKRPFFLENSNYFNTNYTLLYTRNIVDPEYGARLTGKMGKVSLGVLFANDRSPGQVVANTDPEFGKKAQFAVGRMAYDIFGTSTIGVMYTDREFDGSFNRIGGIDGTFKWKKNYFANFQALESSTRDLAGNYSAGPAMDGTVGYSSRRFSANTYFESNASGYQTQVGFFSRPDYTRFSPFVNYRWWPKNSLIVNHGPNLAEATDWDHSGLRLDYTINPGYHFEFKGNTDLDLSYHAARSTLRPKDDSRLIVPRDYANSSGSIYFETNYFKKANFWVQGVWEDMPNLIPVSGPPRPAFERNFSGNLTLKLLTRLQIVNTYLGDYWRDAIVHNQNLYDLHVFRTKWNYQINKEMSVRFIGQYKANLSHPELVALDTTKSFNYDILFTYLLHPGTAVYVGYNTNLSTLDPALIPDPNGFLQRNNQYINDGRQLFVKVSYLLRF
jgi:hypothetical protein